MARWPSAAATRACSRWAAWTSARASTRCSTYSPGCPAPNVIAGGPARAQLRKDKTYLRLTRLAGRLGVADRLSVTGKVAPGGLPALLRSADLLVSAAPYDASGAIALAAMACGTPVAALTSRSAERSSAGRPPGATFPVTDSRSATPRRPARRVRCR